MKKFTLGALALSLVLLGGCIKKDGSNKPVFKINGHAITQAQFDKKLDQNISIMLRGAEFDKTKPENKYIYLINKNQVVNEIIMTQLLQDEAAKRKIKVSDKEVTETLATITEKMGGKEKFAELLKKNNLTEEALKENVKLELTQKKLTESLAGNSEVSKEEIKKFYEENKEKHFKHDKQVRASHILVNANENDIKMALKAANAKLTDSELGKKAQAKAKEAFAKIQKIQIQLQKSPEKFAELAKLYSEDTSSATKGGDLGFFPEGEMVPEFSKVAFTLKPGKISEIIKTQFGYHILKVVDRQEAGTVPFEEVAPHIKKYMESMKKMNALKSLLETAKQTAKIEYVQKDYDPAVIEQELREIQAQHPAPEKPGAPAAPSKAEKK